MIRHRERGALSQATVVKEDYNPDGSFYSSTTLQTDSKASGKYETITDVTTPFFKKKRSAGEIIMSPVTQTSDRRDSINPSIVLGPLPVWGKRVLTGDVACMVSVPYAFSSNSGRRQNCREMAVTKAHAKVASYTSMGLVSIAEAHKTAAMLKSPFKSARSLLDKMDNHRLSELQKGKTLLKAAQNAWLEYRLGWKPLMYDIQSTVSAYQGLTGSKEKVRLVARASQQIEDNYVDEVAGAPLSGVHWVRTARTFQQTYKASCGVLYELTEGADGEKARRFGLSLSAVPSTVWELVTGSWMIDRWIAIGWWLDAITPKPGVNVLGSWLTETETNFNTHSVIDIGLNVVVNGQTFPLRSAGGTYSEVIQSKVRTVNPSLPALPPVNPGTQTLAQLIDDAAFIASRLKIFDVKLPSRRKVISKPRQ